MSDHTKKGYLPSDFATYKHVHAKVDVNLVRMIYEGRLLSSSRAGVLGVYRRLFSRMALSNFPAVNRPIRCLVSGAMDRTGFHPGRH